MFLLGLGMMVAGAAASGFASGPFDKLSPVLGIVYFVMMTLGAFTVRLPAEDWKPAGWSPEAQAEMTRLQLLRPE